jgi:hypothetical protein
VVLKLTVMPPPVVILPKLNGPEPPQVSVHVLPDIAAEQPMAAARTVGELDPDVV